MGWNDVMTSTPSKNKRHFNVIQTSPTTTDETTTYFKVLLQIVVLDGSFGRSSPSPFILPSRVGESSIKEQLQASLAETVNASGVKPKSV